MAIIALFTRIRIIEISAADAKGVAALVAEISAAVTIAKIPATIRPGIDRVQTVMMLRLLETCE